MPKVVTTKNEATGLIERISISDPHRFDHIGCPRPRRSHPRPYEPIPGRCEELACLARLNFTKDQLVKPNQSHSLAARLRTPFSLINRIEPNKPALPEFKPVPEIRFLTKKQVGRGQVFAEKFKAVETRFRAISENLDRLKGTHDELRSNIIDRANRFNEIVRHWRDKLRDFMKEKKWAKIEKDLKAFGAISFKGLKGRYVEICEQIVALDN